MRRRRAVCSFALRSSRVLKCPCALDKERQQWCQCREAHGYMDTYGYLHLGSIADTGYFGYLSITHTVVCVILALGWYPQYRSVSRIHATPALPQWRKPEHNFLEPSARSVLYCLFRGLVHRSNIPPTSLVAASDAFWSLLALCTIP